MDEIIMSWGECDIKIGPTGAADALATVLTSVGTIKEKSTVLEHADGEEMKAYRTGHKLVAYEEQDGDMTVKARIIEPDFALLATLIDATHDDVNDTLTVKSMVVEANQSIVVTPKNIGATGIKARKTKLKIRKGSSEEEGMFADLTFTILECSDGELVQFFKKPAA